MTRMNIVIDARWIFKEISGIGEYTRRLVRHVAELDSESRYVLLFNDPSIRERTLDETGLRSRANFETRIIPHGIFAPSGQFALPGILKAETADIFHSTNYMIPLPAFPRDRTGATACVVTIHDVIPLIFPREIRRSKKGRLLPLFRLLMREIGRRAHAIVTDSQASAADIRSHLRIAPEDPRVRVIHCGVSGKFTPESGRPPGPGETRTVLYVGRADPYKNLVTLIRAFAAARESVPFPLRLCIAGSPDPRYPEPRALVRHLGLEGCVQWTGYVTDAELLRLYRTAEVLAHPSRYEGFGLQVVEAMACGLPVVCSNAGSLPEVAGDAALVAAPDDVRGFTAHIVDVLTRPELAVDLRTKGFRQAARFTWERTAAETLALYRELGRRRKEPAS